MTRRYRKVNLTGSVQRTFSSVWFQPICSQSRDGDEKKKENKVNILGFICDKEKEDKDIKAALQGYM